MERELKKGRLNFFFNNASLSGLFISKVKSVKLVLLYYVYQWRRALDASLRRVFNCWFWVALGTWRVKYVANCSSTVARCSSVVCAAFNIPPSFSELPRMYFLALPRIYALLGANPTLYRLLLEGPTACHIFQVTCVAQEDKSKLQFKRSALKLYF